VVCGSDLEEFVVPGCHYSVGVRGLGVLLATEGGFSYCQTAKFIGCNDTTIADWVNKASLEPMSDSDDRYKNLSQKELVKLLKLRDEENQFLKKAKAFFEASDQENGSSS